MDASTMQKHSFWTTDKKDDLWIMESYCTVPSCRIKNLATGEMRDFGMGGLTAKEFNPVEMDKALEDRLVWLFRNH